MGGSRWLDNWGLNGLVRSLTVYVQEFFNEREVRTNVATVDRQMTRKVFSVARRYFATTLSQMTVQKSVGLIGPLAIGATDARLTVHLVTYIVRTFEKKQQWTPMRLWTKFEKKKEEKKFQIIHKRKQKSKRSRISSPGFHIDTFFLNKRIQEQAIQARFKLGWQSLPCSSWLCVFRNSLMNVMKGQKLQRKAGSGVLYPW